MSGSCILWEEGSWKEAEIAEGVEPGEEELKTEYYGVFACDLTFSIGLQIQAERARASSGTVNKVMYSCGMWAACGDPRGHPIPPKGDQLSPSLWQSLFAPHTPQFCKTSESQGLGCALDGDKEVSLLKAWARGQ